MEVPGAEATAPRAPKSSAYVVRIEALKALRGVGFGERCVQLTTGEGSGEICAHSPEFFLIFELKKASYQAFSYQGQFWSILGLIKPAFDRPGV